jgi:sulfur-oxidizing protein SoxY
VVFESGDNTTVAVGEAEPLNLDYGRAEMFGDHYTVWTETDTGYLADPIAECYPNNPHGTTDVSWAEGTGFCNEFDTLEGFPTALSEEAALGSSFLKGTLAGSVVAIAAGAGILTPSLVLAEWPKDAFAAKTVDEALAAAGMAGAEASSDITVKAPDIAENGAVVPVEVSTSMKAEEIAILADKNGTPLSCKFILGANTAGYISTRLKMGKTGNVIAVVKSGGKLYKAHKEVKVTIGGCGG